MKPALSVLKHPVATEKALRFIEDANKLTFIIPLTVTKTEVRKAVEEEFKARVVKVNTVILPTGKKKAYVKLAPEFPARDVATQLGLL
ncbi:50S ribosomal protein L23 [Candidatus Woesearchaeota archaeon]|nr:50S ribosomal protein L23 [Candidatus Woesearchaeota archaeon]